MCSESEHQEKIMKDNYERVIDYMRISITDRCNLRCQYCMPEDMDFVPHNLIMRYEELLRLSRLFAKQGIRKIKVTGGEPLVRHGCQDFIRGLKAIDGIENVTLTTNGVMLGKYLPDLLDAGVDAINVSLDTLNRDKYRQITGRDEFDRVWSGIQETAKSGVKLKLNCVPIGGINDDEIPDFFELAKNSAIDVRFIEMMPIGHGKNFDALSVEDILALLKERYDNIYEIQEKKGNGPAIYFENAEFKGSIGLIGAVHKKFCSSCNRIRLTSEGFLKLCLYYSDGVDLRSMVRGGASDEEIEAVIAKAIADKPQEHHFSCDVINTVDNMCGGQSTQLEEIKNMSQIGG